jgi:type II secretory ATPase GspE/PulE/Tfp pilus assembly ATPase PilB-like protein
MGTARTDAVRKRSNVMPKQKYCEMMRTTNPGQRELVSSRGDVQSETLLVFFTGPAGSGKTYTLKTLMETYN